MSFIELVVNEISSHDPYAQSISLTTHYYYYELRQNSIEANRAAFGMSETIAGANATLPVLRALDLSLLGEINLRFVELRGNHDQPSSSTEQVFTEATAPGLASQPAFIQFGDGARLEPGLFNDHLQLN